MQNNNEKWEQFFIDGKWWYLPPGSPIRGSMLVDYEDGTSQIEYDDRSWQLQRYQDGNYSVMYRGAPIMLISDKKPARATEQDWKELGF